MKVRVACTDGLMMELETDMKVEDIVREFTQNYEGAPEDPHFFDWAVISTKDDAGQMIQSFTRASSVLNFTIIPEQKVKGAGIGILQ